MNPADLAALVLLCISPECKAACVSPLVPASEFNRTIALPCPPRVEVAAAAVPKRVVKRKSVRKVKLADRCGAQKAVWYFNKKENRRKYKCQ